MINLAFLARQIVLSILSKANGFEYFEESFLLRFVQQLDRLLWFPIGFLFAYQALTILFLSMLY